jgi:integrase
VEALKARQEVYEVGDPACPGLQIRVAPNGTKSWHWRFSWNGKRVRLTMGTYPAMNLAEAHQQSEVARALLRRGIDPRRAGLTRAGRVRPETADFDAAPGHSVAHLAREFMERHVIKRRRRPHYVQRSLDADVLPYWRHRDARTIKPREVIELLDRVVDRSPVMANRLAGILSQMFRFGIHRAIVETSPVQLLYKPGGKEPPRTRMLSEEELKTFLTRLEEACRYRRLPHVLRLLLLTMQRRGELSLAEWQEFDFEKKTWTIPGDHTKTGKGHVLPLSNWALEELRSLKVMAGRSPYVLPNLDGSGPLDPKYITRGVARCQNRFRKLGIAKFSAHDLRRTGRTGLGRLRVKFEVAERVLNHARDKIHEAYDLHDYLDEKREALDKWEQYLKSLRDDCKVSVESHPDMGDPLRGAPI